MAGQKVLQMQGICKSFPGVQALDHADFDLAPGEIHALVGENGAGKSTLMKILCGVYQPDAGEILLQGKRVVIHSPREAQLLGIAIVPQELNLFLNLSVAENLLAGHQPVRGPLQFVDWKTASRITLKYLSLFELKIDPACQLNRLSIAQQQVIEIAKALSQNARILILDEPTSALTEHESGLLFRAMRHLKEEGLCIIYISHRLEEVFEIADRVTVLRDGRWVGTMPLSEATTESIVHMMVGRQLQDLYGRSMARKGPEVLRVEGLSAPGRFENISFRLCQGEILGLAGLIGAGRTDVARAIFGAQRITTGHIYLDGREVHIRSPQDAMNLGIAYLSENRHRDGLFLRMSLYRNITVSHLKRLSRLGFMNQDQERTEASHFVHQMRISTPSLEQQVMHLSGGNQQKVLLARWLAIPLKVLIADEPTHGIDVGAKSEIYKLFHELAAQGVGILLISSEMPEILGLSDRVLVMHEGRITGELSQGEATAEKILTYAAIGGNEKTCLESHQI